MANSNLINRFGDTAATFWQKTTLMASLAGNPNALPADFEDMLEAYYMNNGLYDAIQEYMNENAIWTPGMQSLYNPAFRAVEFHVSHLWAGPLSRSFRVVDENNKLADPILKILNWSNWASKKQLAARWYALFGTMFIKAHVKEGTSGKKVVLQQIKARYVTEFECDSSDFITYIRIDSKKMRLNQHTKRPENYTRTEVWDKKNNSYKVFEHTFERTTPISQLGNPIDAKKITEFGIDFIPIVHAKFIDNGEPRGLGVFVNALDKIDEANRIATRLHDITFRFNRAYIGIETESKDTNGRPLPTPKIMDRAGNDVESSEDLNNDESLVILPPGSSIKMLVPEINMEGHLKQLVDQMDEIKQDLPELRYYDVREPSGISTETMRMMLGGAVDRVVDARTNAYAAVTRAIQMGLTLAKVNDIEGFKNFGKYETGELDFSFADSEVLPLTKKERADIVKASTEAGMDIIFSMRQAGYSEEEISVYKKSMGYLVLLQTRANESGLPIEFLLREEAGYTDSELKEFAKRKLEAIAIAQEDVIPEIGQ